MESGMVQGGEAESLLADMGAGSSLEVVLSVVSDRFRRFFFSFTSFDSFPSFVDSFPSFVVISFVVISFVVISFVVISFVVISFVEEEDSRLESNLSSEESWDMEEAKSDSCCIKLKRKETSGAGG